MKQIERKILIGFTIALTVTFCSIAYSFSFGSVTYQLVYNTGPNLTSACTESAETSNNKSLVLPQVIVKYVESRRQRLDYLARYPNFLKCKNEYSASRESLNLTKSFIDQTSSYNYSQPADQSLQKLRITRAVLVYYPIDKISHYEYEFRWLYRSWVNIQQYEPSNWRTDLVVFIKNDPAFFNKSSFFLNELNCSFENKRKSAMDKPVCTLINYIPITQRNLDPVMPRFVNDTARFNFILKDISIFNNGSNSLFQNVFYDMLKRNLANYGYADSILMAFDGYEYFKSAGYDFLIRSDMDVFLTPLFAQWVPRFCNDFYVGGGGYSSNFNSKRFRRIARELGFEYADANNLGSTWYSTPEQFRLVSFLTLFSMAYLASEEFTQPEREGKVGTLLWPEWHYGVLLLYGQHLALNHLIGANQLYVVKLESLIDYPSGNEESVFTKLHIHVFHGDNMFSKFAFRMGKYDSEQVKSEDEFKVKYYALKMALDGKRIRGDQLYGMLVNETVGKT